MVVNQPVPSCDAGQGDPGESQELFYCSMIPSLLCPPQGNPILLGGKLNFPPYAFPPSYLGFIYPENIGSVTGCFLPIAQLGWEWREWC